MTRKELDRHFDIINHYPIGLVYDTVEAEINDLKECQIEINNMYRGNDARIN